MSTHEHHLAETPEADLSAGKQLLNGSYTSYFNRRHRRSRAPVPGPLQRAPHRAFLDCQPQYPPEPGAGEDRRQARVSYEKHGNVDVSYSADSTGARICRAGSLRKSRQTRSGFAVVRSQGQGLAVEDECFDLASHLLQGEATVVQVDAVIRLPAERLEDALEGVVPVPASSAKGAEQIQGVRVVWRSPKEPATRRLGGIEPPLAVVVDHIG